MSSESSIDERLLRLRAILNAQFTVVLVICLFATAIGAGFVYTTHINPGTETEIQTNSPLTVETEHSHSAEVTDSNPIFDTGTVLDDRETYFTQITPELDVDVKTAYNAEAADSVDMTVESVLVIRNVEDEFVYWDRHETLTTEERTGVDSGDTIDTSFTFDSSELAETADAIEDAVGDSPGDTEMVVVTTVDVDGTIEGESQSHTQTVELDIQYDGDTYTVSDPGVESDSVENTVEVTADRTYGPLRLIGGPLLFGLGLAGVVGLGYVRQEFDLDLTTAETQYLSYRDDRSEFDEWITQIRLPPSAHERETAIASTLADLVDLAIDRETGVIFDPQTDAYHAVSDEYIFTYYPPLSSESSMGGSDTDNAPTKSHAEQTKAEQSDANDERCTESEEYSEAPPQ